MTTDNDAPRTAESATPPVWAEVAINEHGRATKLYEPAMVIGSTAGVSARCQCNAVIERVPTMGELIQRYTEHVVAQHSAGGWA